MSDAQLRNLERRWKETGSVEDEVAWLRARVQAGALEPWRFELAERCRTDPIPERGPPLPFGEWVASLPFAGRRGRLRAEWARVPLAVASALRGVATRLGDVEAIVWALERVEASVVGASSTEETGPLAEARAALAEFIYEEHPDTWETLPPLAAIALFVDAAWQFHFEGNGSPDEFETWAKHALDPQGVWAVEPGVDAAIESSFPRADGRLWALRVAVAAELRPWALGYRDPVRERVQARDE